MSANTVPIAVGTASANSAHSSDLGKVWTLAGIQYRLVKAANAIAAAGKKVVTTALSSGAPTHVVDTTTTVNDAQIYGVIPSGQTGSTGTTGLVAGDYFLLQISGACQVITNETNMAKGAIIGTATVAGYVATNALTTVAGPLLAFGIATLSQTETTGSTYMRINRVL